MKKTTIVLALLVALVLGSIATAEACGTNMAYSVFRSVPVGGMVWSPALAMGGEYVGVYFKASQVINLIAQFPNESGWVVATDRSCGGHTFFLFSGGKWWPAG